MGGITCQRIVWLERVTRGPRKARASRQCFGYTLHQQQALTEKRGLCPLQLVTWMKRRLAHLPNRRRTPPQTPLYRPIFLHLSLQRKRFRIKEIGRYKAD